MNDVSLWLRTGESDRRQLLNFGRICAGEAPARSPFLETVIVVVARVLCCRVSTWGIDSWIGSEKPLGIKTVGLGVFAARPHFEHEVCCCCCGNHCGSQHL